MACCTSSACRGVRVPAWIAAQADRSSSSRASGKSKVFTSGVYGGVVLCHAVRMRVWTEYWRVHGIRYGLFQAFMAVLWVVSGLGLFGGLAWMMLA